MPDRAAARFKRRREFRRISKWRENLSRRRNYFCSAIQTIRQPSKRKEPRVIGEALFFTGKFCAELFLRHFTHDFHCLNADGADALEQINRLFFIIGKLVSVKAFGNGCVRGFFLCIGLKSIRLPSGFRVYIPRRARGTPVKVVCESIVIVPFSLSARSLVCGLATKGRFSRFRSNRTSNPADLSFLAQIQIFSFERDKRFASRNRYANPSTPRPISRHCIEILVKRQTRKLALQILLVFLAINGE